MYKPVFLFGFDRSGTTLLSMMVGAHPDIAVPFSATGLWYRYGNALERYNHLSTEADIVCIIEDLMKEERVLLWDVDLGRDELLDGLPLGSYPSIVARFHERYAYHKGKKYWGNIDIATLYDMDAVHSWFPEARFVHIVRDGRDVALSHKSYRYGASNIGECAERWGRNVHTNLKMGSVLGSSRYLVLRYEDLILNSEVALRRLSNFMGVDYSEEMLGYQHMVDEKIPQQKRFLWPAINQPPMKSKVNRWKTEMTESQRIVFEGTAGKMLHELDYEVYESLPKRPWAYILELWYFLDRGHRFRRFRARMDIGKALARRFRRS